MQSYHSPITPAAAAPIVPVAFYPRLRVTTADCRALTWPDLVYYLTDHDVLVDKTQAPLWSPVVDLLKTRRQWIWAMQFFLGALLAGVALMISAPHFVSGTIVFFALLAFASATARSLRIDLTRASTIVDSSNCGRARRERTQR